MNLERGSLKDSLSKKHYFPFYFLYGEETFLLEESLHELVETLLEGGLRDFNVESFSSFDFRAQQIIDAAETLPMMAQRRVILIKEAQDLKSQDFEQLVPLIENPIPSTVLIFCGTKVDQRLKFIKAFSKTGALVKFQRPFENQIPSWIQSMVAKNDKKISPAALQLLQQYVGVSLMDLNQEIQKLSMYVGEKEQIEIEDVRKVVSRIRIESVFALAHALGTRNRESSLLCLVQLLEHDENPIGILALLARHVRILIGVKDGLEEGLSQSQLSSRLGVPPPFLREYLLQAQSWTEGQLSRAHAALSQTDIALKSSPLSSGLWLENLVFQICGEVPR